MAVRFQGQLYLVFSVVCLFFGGCSLLMRQAPHLDSTPSISSRLFGVLSNGEPVTEFTLSSGRELKVSILTWGGIIRSIEAPGRDGTTADITLGYDSLPPYESRHPYFGTITGRFANRIAQGHFILDGESYKLATNNGPNHLHGGINGFDRKNWSASTENFPDSVALILNASSPDGDEGYPGAVSIQVRYTLDTNNALRIDYRATTTKATPINLTSHGYFNLAGHDSGDVLNHHLQIFADSYLPVDETLIPTGAITPVQGSPFDFTTPHPIGSRIKDVGIGYDHNFVLSSHARNPLQRAAYAWDPESGRSLELWTTQPGVQLYTGNYLTESEVGKGGAHYQKHAGFCLEAQGFPDAINQPQFPSSILRPGETYAHTTVMRFGVH